MPRTRVKICGITRAEDALDAAELGADFIGLNLLSGPRRIDRGTLMQIYWGLRDEDSRIKRRVDIVALCSGTFDECRQTSGWAAISPYPLDFYQIYAPKYEPVSLSPFLDRKWWMVAGIKSRESIVDAAVAVGLLPNAPAALLFDTAAEKLGGTGKSFDWNWIADARAAGELNGLPPIILAGGLTPENVAEAIRIARPWAVDVSSGVEVAGKPGIKDPIKMRDFIQAAQGAG